MVATPGLSALARLIRLALSSFSWAAQAPPTFTNQPRGSPRVPQAGATGGGGSLSASHGGGGSASGGGGRPEPAGSAQCGGECGLGRGHLRLPRCAAAQPRVAGASESGSCASGFDTSSGVTGRTWGRRRCRPPLLLPRRSHPLRQLCRVQVRNAQLDKEASELRAENETLLRAAEDAKHSAVQSAQVRRRRRRRKHPATLRRIAPLADRCPLS